MKVWVVFSDCGLNGPYVHGVYTTLPDMDKVEEFVNTDHGTGRISGTTGYQATHIDEFTLDAELQ